MPLQQSARVRCETIRAAFRKSRLSSDSRTARRRQPASVNITRHSRSDGIEQDSIVAGRPHRGHG